MTDFVPFSQTPWPLSLCQQDILCDGMTVSGQGLVYEFTADQDKTNSKVRIQLGSS